MKTGRALYKIIAFAVTLVLLIGAMPISASGAESWDDVEALAPVLKNRDDDEVKEPIQGSGDDIEATTPVQGSGDDVEATTPVQGSGDDVEAITLAVESGDDVEVIASVLESGSDAEQPDDTSLAASEDEEAAVTAPLAAGGGTGVPDTGWYTANPDSSTFTINTADQLAGLAQIVNGTAAGVAQFGFPDRTIILGNDIDLSCYGENNKGWNVSKGWVPIGVDPDNVFMGTFNGNNRIIERLYINDRQIGCAGLFGCVSGVIKNLGITDSDISTSINAHSTVGGVVGSLDGVNGLIENCYFKGNIYGNKVGGIVGYISGAKVLNCYSTGVAEGSIATGGIAGQIGNTGASLTNCYSTSVIIGYKAVGGVVGYVTTLCLVANCAALNSKMDGVVDIGRVAGINYEGIIKDNVAFDNMDILRNGRYPIKNQTGDNNGISVTIEELQTAKGFPWNVEKEPWTYSAGMLPGLFGNAEPMPSHLDINFKPNPTFLTAAHFSFSPKSATFNGEEQEVTVTPAPDANYIDIKYDGWIDPPTSAGTYEISVDVIEGSPRTIKNIVLGTFKIKPANLSKIKVTIANKTWTGKQIKPASFTYNGIKYSLVDGKNVMSAYTSVVHPDWRRADANATKHGTNIDIGKGTVTIKGAGRNFTGEGTISFKIVPKANKVSKIVAGKKQLRVQWNNESAAQKVTRYEVRYREKGTETWKIKSFKASAPSATIKNLKKGSQYEVQVRCYKSVNGKKYYSKWSSKKTSKKIK